MIKIEELGNYVVARIPVESLYAAFTGQDLTVNKLVAWCNETFGPPGIWGGPINGRTWKNMSNDFYFESMEDALLFKLTWEGQIPECEIPDGEGVPRW